MTSLRQPDSPLGSGRDAVGTVADVVERLIQEFQGTIPPAQVSRTVLSCRADLSGAPAPATPELLERLAHERLRAGNGL